MRTIRSSSRLSQGGCLFQGRWVSAPGGSAPLEGCLLCGGGMVSQHALRQNPSPSPPPPPCGQTHACKNKTFATSLRTVKIGLKFVTCEQSLTPFVMNSQVGWLRHVPRWDRTAVGHTHRPVSRFGHRPPEQHLQGQEEVQRERWDESLPQGKRKRERNVWILIQVLHEMVWLLKQPSILG